MTGNHAAVAIAVDEKLTDFDRTLMWYLAGLQTVGGLAPIKQVDMAADTGRTPMTISNSVKRLCAAGYLMRKGNVLQINPHFAFMGTGGQHQLTVAQMDQAVPEIAPPRLRSQEKAPRVPTPRTPASAATRRGGRHKRSGDNHLEVLQGGAAG